MKNKRNIGEAHTNEIEKMRPLIDFEEVMKSRKRCGVEFYNRYSKLFINVPCPACGSAGEYLFKKYGFLHRKCTKCLTIWCANRPTEKLLIDYYSNWEAAKKWTQLLIQADSDRRLLQYSPRVEMIIDILKADDNSKNKLAVDLGAGSGAFSLALKEVNYFNEVLAVDFNKECIEACKKTGLNTLLGSVENLNPDSVDLLIMNDLIEHVFDPKKFLEQCYNVLTHNGYLAIACPNGEGFDFKIMKDQTVNITPPEHLNYFNPYSIELLLESIGFKVLSTETPGILDAQIIVREVNAGRLDLDNNNEYLDYLLMQSDIDVVISFQDFLIKNKLSSHMMVLAKKPSS